MTLFGHNLNFHRKHMTPSKPANQNPFSRKLSEIRPGDRAQIRCFAPEMSATRWAHLQAYGLIPGRWVQVVQQFPVTVIVVEHCELALENDLASLIEIQPE